VKRQREAVRERERERERRAVCCITFTDDLSCSVLKVFSLQLAGWLFLPVGYIIDKLEAFLPSFVLT